MTIPGTKISEYPDGGALVAGDKFVIARGGQNRSIDESQVGGGGGGGGDKYPMEARLTLETGVPISTTDQTAKTTLYLTKYKGDQIAVYDGSSAWETIALGADLSITLAGLTAGLPYDVFVYSNAGTLTLELTAWTNTTTRATALTTQNGIYVKTGATTRRYLGTICITAVTGQCEDSYARRLVWNYYNQEPRILKKTEATATWTYTTATWRSANNSTANRVEFVTGALTQVDVVLHFNSANSSGVGRSAGIGLDVTNANNAPFTAAANPTTQMSAHTLYSNYLLGYHYLQWVEISDATGTTTWWGTVTDRIACGISGEILG